MQNLAIQLDLGRFAKARTDMLTKNRLITFMLYLPTTRNLPLDVLIYQKPINPDFHDFYEPLIVGSYLNGC